MTFAHNVTAIKLATAIWHARSEPYGLVVRDFPTLELQVKADYIARAEAVLDDVRPTPATQ